MPVLFFCLPSYIIIAECCPGTGAGTEAEEMKTAQDKTYEALYYSLWELAQRYSGFTQFRVIGKSHDERMIPMLEIGQGESCIFCVGGFSGTDGKMAGMLTITAAEYCRNYECKWMVQDFYDVKKLLDQTRICLIPVINPDGYEIFNKGYNAVRNPIFRQMLKMQDIPCDEFVCNARGMDLTLNFPTSCCTRKKLYQQPASENETKALIRIFQEYGGRGLLVFCVRGIIVFYYRQSHGFSNSQKCHRLARHLKKCADGQLERLSPECSAHMRNRSTGRPEQYYGESIKRPAFRIELPVGEGKKDEEAVQELMRFPLEYIYSLVQ